MPASTTRLALPYPLPDDTVDVPRDVKAQADKLDPLIMPPTVTALPSSPYDGQEVYYVADAAAGVVWHLKYRAASVSAYKWEFVGGAPLEAEVPGGIDTTSSAAYVDLAQVGPQIAVPLGGDFVYQFSATGQNNTANQGVAVAVKLGAGATADAEAVLATSSTASADNQLARILKRTGRPAETVKLQYRTSGGGTATFYRRSLAITPVRVG